MSIVNCKQIHSSAIVVLMAFFGYVIFDTLNFSSINRLYQHDQIKLLISTAVYTFALLESSTASYVAMGTVNRFMDNNGCPPRCVWILFYSLIRVCAQILFDHWPSFAPSIVIPNICDGSKKIWRASTDIQAVLIVASSLCIVRFYIIPQLRKAKLQSECAQSDKGDEMVDESVEAESVTAYSYDGNDHDMDGGISIDGEEDENEAETEQTHEEEYYLVMVAHNKIVYINHEVFYVEVREYDWNQLWDFHQEWIPLIKARDWKELPSWALMQLSQGAALPG